MDQQPDSRTIQSNNSQNGEAIEQQTKHAELPTGGGCPNHDTFSAQLEAHYIQTLHDFAKYVKEKSVYIVLDDLEKLGYGNVD